MYMKFRNIILSAISSVSIFASCNFLEVEKLGKSDIESFFSDVYALESAVNGLYNLTYSFYDSYMILYPEVTGDMIEYSTTTTNMLEQYNFNSKETEETGPVGYIWRRGYEIILNANEIIEFGAPLANEYPEQINRINASFARTYFIRALALLDLSLCYAQHYTYTADASHLGVAVLTYLPPVDTDISRSSVKDTYDRIITDLNTAISLFPQGYSFNVDFASPAACEALLARVYLYMGQYEDAATHADNVIRNYGLSLTPYKDYVKMFCSVDYPEKESIFRLNGFDLGTSLHANYDYNQPAMRPSQKLRDIFDEDAEEGMHDIRDSLTMYKDNAGIEYTNVCMKYSITYNLNNTAERLRHYDPIVLRLAEMYLIRAEANCALNNLDDAADDIATLRERAYNLAEGSVTIDYTDAADLDAIIERERIKELFLEGHRLFDITRRKKNLERDPNTNSTVKGISYPDDRFILPIPLVELDANKSMQSNPINDTQQ